MTPDWNIGPVARSRLAEMTRDGLPAHKIQHFSRGRWIVELTEYSTMSASSRLCVGRGNTIGQAVADAWRKWKAEKLQDA